MKNNFKISILNRGDFDYLHVYIYIFPDIEIVNNPPTQLEVIPASFTDIFTDIMQDYFNTRPITLCRLPRPQ